MRPDEVVTIVSASYGGYDQPCVPPVQDILTRWVMVNDGLVDVPEPWESHVTPRNHLHPRMAAKVPKCLPHEYAWGTPVIWLDASALVMRPDFASTCLAALGDGDVAMWVHPQRDDILEEAVVSAGMEKYAGQRVNEQASTYTIGGGVARHSGLWATGCMTWASADSYWPSAGGPERIGKDWLSEQVAWTYQDQLSWPYIVHRNKLDVRPMPGMLWDRQLVTFRPHASNL